MLIFEVWQFFYLTQISLIVRMVHLANREAVESWNHWNQTTFTTWEQLLQLVISQSCTWRCRKACLRRN